MASQNSGRKKQQRAKAGVHKVSHEDNHKMREHAAQQRHQPNQNLHKHNHYHQIQPQQKQQHHQQQQQVQQQHTCSSDKSLQNVTSKVNAQECKVQHSDMSLFSAVICRRHDIVDTLLKSGAKPCETDQCGNTPFMAACKIGDVHLMSTLWQVSDSNLSIQHINNDGESALHLCSESGHEEGCRFLLSRNIDLHIKNKSGNTALHLAAKNDHINVCQALINTDTTPKRQDSDIHRYVLEENKTEQTPVCVSITNHHAEVTRLLLDVLRPQQQINYLTSRLRKCAIRPQALTYNSNQGQPDRHCQEVFLHGLLVTLSVLLIRLSEKRKRDDIQRDLVSRDEDIPHEQCLANTDVIQSLAMIACNRHANQQIVVISCFLLVYLMEGLSERHEEKMSSAVVGNEKENKTAQQIAIPQTGELFLKQLLQCRGPENLVDVLNSMDVAEPSNAIVSMATTTPFLFLSRSVIGRSWLETNKCHLTFLKELLLQHSSAFALLTSTCPLLQLSYLESTCKDFIKLVEVMEDRDREQNLVELIWEEERDRMKRERKKQKRHQKKLQASKQPKRDDAMPSVKMLHGSSDDETEASPVKKYVSNDDKTKLLTNQGEISAGEPNVSQDCGNHIFQDGTSSACCDIASKKSGAESKKYKSASEIVSESKDYPPMPGDSLVKCRKLNVGSDTELHKQEIAPLGNLHSNDTGAIPKTIRWADVAKSGRKDMDGNDQKNSDGHSTISPDRFTTCCWPRSNRQKDSCATPIKEDEVDASKQNVSHCCVTDSAWYGAMGHEDMEEINSDNESNSSSSSTGSHSSYVSDSFAQTRKLTWLSKKVQLNIDMTTDNSLSCKNNIALNLCPSINLNDPQTKVTQSCKQDILCPTESSRGLHSNGLKSQSYICKDARVGLGEEKRKPQGMISSLFSSRCDEIVNDSSCFTNDKNWLLISCKGLGVATAAKMTMSNTPNWKDPTPTAFRIDDSPSLPPLKLNDPEGTVRSSLRDSSSATSRNDTGKMDTISMDVQQCSNRNKQSFLSSGSPINTLNAHDNHMSFAYKQNIPDSQKILTPWTHLSAHTPVSTMQLRPFSILALPGQNITNANSLASYQIHKMATATKTVSVYQEGINDEGKNKTNDINKGQTFNKERAITTVLLDKVKNPPIFLQQSKVPPLSSLAWRCGEESSEVWGKVVRSKKTPFVKQTKAAFETVHTSSPPFPRVNLEATKLCQNSLTPHEQLNDYSLGSSQSTNLSKSDTTMLALTNETQSFSTVLMNRMQLRRQSSLTTQNIPKETEAEQMNGGISAGSIPDFNHKENKSSQPNTFCEEISMTEHHNIPGAISTGLSNKQYDHRAVKSKFIDDRHCQTQLMSKTCESKDNQEPNVVKIARKHKESILGLRTENNKEVSLFNYRDRGPFQHVESGNTSPPVFFPEQIRDDVNRTTGSEVTFPGFHDVLTSDFLSEMFSDPLFNDKIAINQIRQKILSSHTNQTTNSAQSTVANDIDLDYYASLYQMKFRNVLGRLPGQDQADLLNTNESRGHKPTNNIDRNIPKSLSQPLGMPSMSKNSLHGPATRVHSSRWRPSLQKILDLPWTTRRQYGDIILPHTFSECSIEMIGSVLVLLGLLIDGSEVTVLVMDKTREYISPRTLEIMCDSEMDKHFLARCKSHNESSNIQYIAIPLHEYNLFEYLQICLPTFIQNKSTIVLLVWQLLKAVSFLHESVGAPHGCLAPCWVFIDANGNLRLTGFGIITSTENESRVEIAQHSTDFQSLGYSTCWGSKGDVTNVRVKPSFSSDIQAAGMLAYFMFTRGQHPFGNVPVETESLMRECVGSEAFDLISPMLALDPKSRPSVDLCLKHPIFWAGDKKFRLILIVGSDVLTEMKTGVALTGNGAPTMMEILSLVDINVVSPNWIHEVDGTVLKEMRSFRVYKNNLAELTLFVYNCCLHFDKLSNVAKEVLDDPCKYFQNLFPGLFIAIHRSLKVSDRIERTCYKPFF